MARIICTKHGAQSLAQVSPDYAAENHTSFRSTAVLIRYMYRGEPVDAYHLSLEFARKFGIAAGDLPLPDDYPVWAKECKFGCAACFNSDSGMSVVIDLFGASNH